MTNIEINIQVILVCDNAIFRQFLILLGFFIPLAFRSASMVEMQLELHWTDSDVYGA